MGALGSGRACEAARAGIRGGLGPRRRSTGGQPAPAAAMRAATRGTPRVLCAANGEEAPSCTGAAASGLGLRSTLPLKLPAKESRQNKLID